MSKQLDTSRPVLMVHDEASILTRDIWDNLVADFVTKQLRVLTNEERLAVFKRYCMSCGSDEPLACECEWSSHP